MIFIGDLKPYCLQLDTSRAMQYKRLLEQADRYKQMELPLEHPKESTTYMGIAIAGVAAMANALSDQKKEKEFEELKEAVSELQKNK